MKYHSELADIVEAIDSLKKCFHVLVVDYPNMGSSEEFATQHYEPMFAAYADLEDCVDAAAKSNDEIMAYLRRVALEHVEANTREPVPDPTPKQQKALDFVKEKGKVKGILIARHLGITEGAFRTHYVKKLRKYGLRNDRDGGYYLVSID